jgi:hypothetical protein
MGDCRNNRFVNLVYFSAFAYRDSEITPHYTLRPFSGFSYSMEQCKFRILLAQQSIAYGLMIDESGVASTGINLALPSTRDDCNHGTGTLFLCNLPKCAFSFGDSKWKFDMAPPPGYSTLPLFYSTKGITTSSWCRISAQVWKYVPHPRGPSGVIVHGEAILAPLASNT